MHGESISSGRDLLTLSDLLQRRAQEYANRAALVFYDRSYRGTPVITQSREKKAGLSAGTLAADSLATGVGDEIEARAELEPVCWTYADLECRARRIGAWLSQHAEVGDRALLVYTPGLEFSAAFFGCLYAGVLPVPATYPKPRRPLPRLASMALDCQPRLVLTSQSTLEAISLESQSTALREIPWQATDVLPQCELAAQWQPIARQLDDLAFLQYTSGSTTQPRGVMVTHRNLLHNLEMIRRGFDIPRAGTTDKIMTSVFWLPAYHDMGLIGGILSPLYVGGTSHLLAPADFLRRPLAWLELLSTTGATISGAPNFAYDLCVTKIKSSERAALDLSQWRLAFCGAEPIQAETLQKFAETFAPVGFRSDVFYPCYGLAEATLLVSGTQGPVRPRVLQLDRTSLTQGRIELAQPLGTESTEVVPTGSTGAVPTGFEPARTESTGTGRQSLVGCGSSLDSQELQIVDPHTCRLQADGQVGEIWVRGDSVARGYWRNGELSQEIFAARLIGESSESSDPGEADRLVADFSFSTEGGVERTAQEKKTYMRTGDLGFQHEGQLYITGRLKDLIILRGRNHYPQDIERTAQEAHVAVNLGAAFTVDRLDLVDRGGGEGERKVDMRAGQPFEQLVVVLQILREHRRVNLDEVLRLIRRAIVQEHELDPHAIVLIRPASLPITSSGKVQRSRCRELFLRDELKVNAQWQQKTISQDFPPQDDDSCRDSLPARPDFFELAQAGDPQRLGLAIESWMLAWLAERANLERTALNSATPFAEVGIDSMTSIELNQELEEALQLKIPPVAAWDHPTPSSLARFLADLYLAGRQGQE